ncbi:hypothetical protein RHMOL_Rhmol13G0073900 [Rhododendron molle]|uniref:Uncharacterized protein n=1 Tax=Rhododendron molle TaxID=49168 RepID=A0ACC0L3X7_RHOML|nr:hypothetical protein RHMOL_Rhmol13G0073900 [Rhododendron molle]
MTQSLRISLSSNRCKARKQRPGNCKKVFLGHGRAACCNKQGHVSLGLVWPFQGRK